MRVVYERGYKRVLAHQVARLEHESYQSYREQRGTRGVTSREEERHKAKG